MHELGRGIVGTEIIDARDHDRSTRRLQDDLLLLSATDRVRPLLREQLAGTDQQGEREAEENRDEALAV